MSDSEILSVHRHRSRLVTGLVMFCLGAVSCGGGPLGFPGAPKAALPAIQPYAQNPHYWQYRGRPVVLVGGSKDDNLFQIPDLEQHLDAIVAVGGNYVRNTMSDRQDGGFEVYPFLATASGKFDLEQWNEEYWARLDRFLKSTNERGIVVQLEVWDRFDFSDHENSGHWSRSPYNPRNNINYSEAESKLDAAYPQHPNANIQPFFFTPPDLQNNAVVLRYQLAWFDKLLSYTLRYDHVLYCIDNETSADPRWGRFWADRLHRKAREEGTHVYATEMWDDWDVTGRQHRETIENTELYGFIDISQNNHRLGRKHWDGLQWTRAQLGQRLRPINTVKVYGADGGSFGSTRDAEERFWQNLIGGAAAIRFHRPDTGLGLSEAAKVQIRSARMLLAELDIFRCEPDADGSLLTLRTAREAYLTREPGHQYAVYVPTGGVVELDVSDAPGNLQLRWLDVANTQWREPSQVQGGGPVELTSPGDGQWVALLTTQVSVGSPR